MKVAFIFIIFVLSLNSWAIKNPQIRICLEKQGEFLTVDLNQDSVGLCKLGHSIVGSLDLVFLSQNQSAESMLNYFNRNLICQGKEIQILNSENNLFTVLCIHNDGSIIDLKTLNSGRDSIQNATLNAALGL